ncbi:MAG: DUF7144 family membrane protein [Acidimicrobiales bacterium]
MPSGWATFAAVMFGIVGVWHTLSGIAAIAEDDQTEALQEVLYGVDITAWGWFWIIVGALQLLTSFLIFGRNPIGQVLGVFFAAISASLAVFMIFVAPIWALVVLALDVAVIWALLANPEEWGTT